MKLTNHHIATIKDYFVGQPVLKAFLFGSQVRNEANDNSDVDILVELDYSFPIGLEFIQMQFDLEKLLNKKVDLISERSVSKYIKPIIDAEKKLIYAR